MYTRSLEIQIKKLVKSGKSILLLGPRQVGKTTICHKINFDLEINLASISEKNKFEKDPSMLVYGQLPAIAKEQNKEDKELLLRSYVENYIEEEIRKETRLRNVALFYRFLEAAAIQSGRITNFSQISKELGPIG